MALDFPSPASPGQIYSYLGYTWEYNGTYWKSISTNFYLPISGGTVTGDTVFTSGLTATTISATTYDNLPGSSSSNCFTTFYVTNISGCSPVNVLSLLNVQDGLSVTGTSTFTSQANFTGGISATTFSSSTYQNLPVSAVTSGTGISASTSNGVVTVSNTDLGSSQNIFKNIQVAGVTQFSAGSNSSNLNFSGVNITITSAATNTLVFSAGTGGGSGTVTSVALSAGTSGTDVNISNSAITTSGTITINIPNASYDARGLVSTSGQKFSGNKDFTSGIILSSLNTNQILATDSGSTVQSLSTTTYPSLTELSYVKGVTSAIQTQINNKLGTTGGTISGNLTVTGTTSSATISATTYQNLPVSAVTNGTGISTSTTNGVATITNTDLGSSQNIFKNIQIAGVTQFSAGSNSSNLNFSGINITITSAATNTLVFSAGTGGSGGVTSVTAGSGLSGNSTTGAVTLINTQVQGITGITAGYGISASTTSNVTTIIQKFDYGKSYTTGNNLNFI